MKGYSHDTILRYTLRHLQKQTEQIYCTYRRRGYQPCPKTGRLRELLVPDASVMLSHHPSKHRKTLFVVQFEQAAGFSPNKLMDPGFAEKVEEAKHVGVEVLSYRCVVKPDEVKITDKIPVIL